MEHKFYDKNGNVLFQSYDEDNPLFPGREGNIYDVGEGIGVKIFEQTCLDDDYFPISDVYAFEKLIGMNLENFYKVYNVLYREKTCMFKEEDVLGYTLKIYKTLSDFLSLPMEYLTESLRALVRTVTTISSEHIFMDDLHNRNLILTENGIFIIDADWYYTRYDDNLLNDNLTILYNSLILLISLLFDNNYGSIVSSYDLIKIFNAKNDIDTICKKLTKFKKPIDYLRSIENQ